MKRRKPWKVNGAVMKKIVSFIGLLAVLQVLMLLGLGGYVLASGRLDKEKATTILALLRHTGTPDGLHEHVDLILDPPAATEAAAPAATQKSSGPLDADHAASAADRLAYAQQAVDALRLQLDQQEQELRHRQELLDGQRASLDEKFVELDARKKAFDDAMAAEEAKQKDENFTRAAALYDELKPKQIRDIFMGLPPDVVVRYIKAMDTERAGKIIAEFKTPEEQRFISEVLEKIRIDGTEHAMSTTAPSAGSSASVP
jgi:hypothetical protein